MYSTESNVSRICIFLRTFAANVMQIGPLLYEL